MKEIIYNKKTIKIPAGLQGLDFNSMWDGAGPLETQEVTNQLSGQSCELPNFAAAVYESVMGCNLLAEKYDSKHGTGTSPDWKIVRTGLDWFRRHFAKEYMVLLD
jgi:hypothetical protein